MIKPIWDKYSESISEVNAMIDEFNAGLIDKRTAKAFGKIIAKWNQGIVQHNEIDRLLDPIPAIKVKMPFEGEEFSNAWTFYKEAMVEKHGFTLVSRQEEIRLRRLKTMSGNNPQRAIAMLEFFTDNGYKSIFKPSEKQLTGDEPTKVEEQHPTLDLTKKGAL